LQNSTFKSRKTIVGGGSGGQVRDEEKTSREKKKTRKERNRSLTVKVRSKKQTSGKKKTLTRNKRRYVTRANRQAANSRTEKGIGENPPDELKGSMERVSPERTGQQADLPITDRLPLKNRGNRRHRKIKKAGRRGEQRTYTTRREQQQRDICLCGFLKMIKKRKTRGKPGIVFEKIVLRRGTRPLTGFGTEKNTGLAGTSTWVDFKQK